MKKKFEGRYLPLKILSNRIHEHILHERCF